MSVKKIFAPIQNAETAHGAKLVFSMFGNHHNLRRGTRVLDDIAIAMIEEIGAPPPKRGRRR